MAGPFSTAEFVEHGYSPKILRGQRFRRVYPRVWVAVDHAWTAADTIEAGRLCMPSHARMTDITRIQSLGLTLGSVTPLHFVVESDLHIDIAGIVLHRTIAMPPTDAIGVTPASAFVAFCTHASLIDAIAVGDWLLQRGHMSRNELCELVSSQPWRDGAREVGYLLAQLVERSRSIPESRVRTLLLAAGIEGLEVNALLVSPDGRPLEIDLLARRWNLAIEYEGSHHQEDRGQFLTDIERHAVLRAMHMEYTLITKEHLRDGQGLVRSVHRRLETLGYDRGEPRFGARWRSLFRPVRDLVRRNKRGDTAPIPRVGR